MMGKQDILGILEKHVDDPAVVEFCHNLVYVAHLWDDLIDKDKERSDEAINGAFKWLLVGVNHNRFFRKNVDTLLPLLDCAIEVWGCANHLEGSGDADKVTGAFILRNNLLTVLVYCLKLAGKDANGFMVECSKGLNEQYLVLLEEKCPIR